MNAVQGLAPLPVSRWGARGHAAGRAECGCHRRQGLLPSAPSPHGFSMEMYQAYSPGPGWQNIPADVNYHNGTRCLGKQEKLPRANYIPFEKRAQSEKLLVSGPRAGASFSEGIEPKKEAPQLRGGGRGLHGRSHRPVCLWDGCRAGCRAPDSVGGACKESVKGTP